MPGGNIHLTCIFKVNHLFHFIYLFTLVAVLYVCEFDIRYHCRTAGFLFISILELYLFGNCSEVCLVASDSLTRLVAMENVCDVI